MNNTGEIRLNLPKLDFGFQWNVKLRERDFGVGPELELVVTAERGIYSDQSGGMLPYEVVNGGFVPVERCHNHDELIVAVQQIVDELAARIRTWESSRRTRNDALKHILDTFNTSGDVTKMLHLYDNGNV
jgi:hypothetical protein